MTAVQTAKMATSATPIPVRQHTSSFSFELPLKKRKQRRLQEQEQRQRAALEAEEESRAAAWSYIIEFLRASEWESQMDQITIVCDAVPTMEELESYGDLDEKEGTRACRKLFKAPVVWDELGHGLWKLLRIVGDEKLEQQQQQQQQQLMLVETKSSLWTTTSAELGSTSFSSRRSSRRTSEDSSHTTISQESVSPHASLSSSPMRHGSSIPRIFSRITSRR